MKACLGLETPAAPNLLALTVARILPSTDFKSLGIRNVIDFGAESSEAHLLAVYASLPPVARRKARLATGLPATALAGLDFHQLDSFERFHPLIWNSPLPSLAWRNEWTILPLLAQPDAGNSLL